MPPTQYVNTFIIEKYVIDFQQVLKLSSNYCMAAHKHAHNDTKEEGRVRVENCGWVADDDDTTSTNFVDGSYVWWHL